jgi:hypothetical protein
MANATVIMAQAPEFDFCCDAQQARLTIDQVAPRPVSVGDPPSRPVVAGVVFCHVRNS